MDEQTALYHFTGCLYRAGSQRDICEAVLDAIICALRCKRASILLFDDASIMRFAASRGLARLHALMCCSLPAGSDLV